MRCYLLLDNIINCAQNRRGGADVQKGRGRGGCVSQLMRPLSLPRHHFISVASGSASRPFARSFTQRLIPTHGATDDRSGSYETVSICGVTECHPPHRDAPRLCRERFDALTLVIAHWGERGDADGGMRMRRSRRLLASFCMSGNAHYVMATAMKSARMDPSLVLLV